MAGIQLGEIVAAHGIDGGVKVYPWSDHADRWPDTLKAVHCDRLGEDPVPVAGFRWAAGMPVLKLASVTTREQAMALVGARLWLSEDALPALPSGEYYWFQLVGMRVRDTQGAEVGRVLHVQRAGAHDLLEVSGPGGRALVPFVRAWVELNDVGERAEICLQQEPEWT